MDYPRLITGPAASGSPIHFLMSAIITATSFSEHNHMAAIQTHVLFTKINVFTTDDFLCIIANGRHERCQQLLKELKKAGLHN